MEEKAIFGEIMSDLLKRARTLIDQKMFRGDWEKTRAYEEFLLNELKPFADRLDLDLKDLAEIHGMAAKLAADTSYGEEVNGKRIFSDPNLLQAYCYTLAVYAKFKSKGITLHDMRIGDDRDQTKKGQV